LTDTDDDIASSDLDPGQYPGTDADLPLAKLADVAKQGASIHHLACCRNDLSGNAEDVIASRESLGPRQLDAEDVAGNLQPLDVRRQSHGILPVNTSAKGAKQ
jgi:hypothetical protein